MFVPGGKRNAFAEYVGRFYECPAALKCQHELSITQGWTNAVCVGQRRLRHGDLATALPVLVLCTDADTVLSAKGILEWSRMLSARPLARGADPLGAPLWTKGLCQRRIGTLPWDPSEHDVLAAPSARRVQEALALVLEWVRVQGFAAPARCAAHPTGCLRRLRPPVRPCVPRA